MSRFLHGSRIGGPWPCGLKNIGFWHCNVAVLQSQKKTCAGVITARGLGTWGCASIIMKYELHLDFLIVLNEMSVGMSIYLCVCLPVGFGKKCFCPIIDIQACSVKWRSSHWWVKSLIRDFKNCECSKIMDQSLA